MAKILEVGTEGQHICVKIYEKGTFTYIVNHNRIAQLETELSPEEALEDYLMYLGKLKWKALGLDPLFPQ